MGEAPDDGPDTFEGEVLAPDLQQLLQGPLHLQNLKNFVAMPSVYNVRHVRLVYRWKKSAEGSLTRMSALRRSNAAELTLWSAKLVSQMSPRKSSAEGSLTHMSALRSLPNHLILITATPRI